MPTPQQGYGYVPEMQGMTEMLQREFINNSNRGQNDANRAMSKSNVQSSGSYMGTQARMAGAKTQGLQDIATQNSYKNAMFALEDRRRKEQMEFQRQQAKDAYQRQLEMYRLQQKDAADAATAQMIGGGIGAITGSVFGAPLAALGQSLIPQQADPMRELLMKYYTQQLGVK